MGAFKSLDYLLDEKWERDGNPFTRTDPEGKWLFECLRERAGGGGLLECLHCNQVEAVEAIEAARREYCACGAAWYKDGMEGSA